MGFLLFLVGCTLCVPAVIGTIKVIYRHCAQEGDDSPDTTAMWNSVDRSLAWVAAVATGLCCLVWIFDTNVDYLWYKDVGYVGRFWTELLTRAVLFWAGFIFAGAVFFSNAHVIGRLLKKFYGEGAHWFRMLGVPFSLLVAFIFGSHLGDSWLVVQRCIHGQSFGKTDPIFGMDISFYAFTMPMVDVFVGLAFWVIGLTMAFCVIVYTIIYIANNGNSYDYDRQRSEKEKRKLEVIASGLAHLAKLGFLLAPVLIIDVFMDRYKILYSAHGNVYGAGWTDIFVRIPCDWALILIIAICTVFLVQAASGKHTVRNVIIGFGGMFAFWLVAAICPNIAQAWKVSPNELQVEGPYIQHELDFTRAAYGLDRVKQEDFDVKDGLTQGNLTQDAETLESARIWDWHVLNATNHQVQAFKSYYSFLDEDVLRYTIGGKKTQVMCSAREMDVDKLSDSAKTWQNLHLVYTHGYGAVCNPVNTFTPEGLPDYWVKDIPVTSRYPELALAQPRIYFGEATTNYAYVHTGMKEFDYPVQEQTQLSTYDGPAGIPLGGLFQRLSIAWVFDGIWKTWSDELGPNSKLLFTRDIATRTEKLVPFLWHESDTYQVIADGQLWFMRDFESVTEWYPYSAPHEGINYMRNSVKAVVNAYTGETTFYVFDPDDPVVRTYEAIFPGLFKPASAMPESLRKHVRYPQGLLETQGQMYENYHMNDVTAFYNKEDVWQFAQQFSPEIGKPETVSASYLEMALPGTHAVEYMLLLPFTPKSTDSEHQRNNLEALLAARNDGEHYGELILYKFPTTHQVQGPLQMGIKLNQDSELSKEFTLWNQHGSKVVLGDVRVLPLSDHRLLNVQAIYLQSEGAKMPELKYVVVASGDQVVHEPTFQAALDRLVGIAPVVAPSAGGIQKPIILSNVDLDQEVLNGIDRYLDSLRQGKFSDAGQALQAIRDARAKMKDAKKQ